jgi:hypothetical protein
VQKQKYKDYLEKNGIKSEDDLVLYLDILRNTKNLNIGDRQMLFDFAWMMINDRPSVLSFFTQEKTPSNKFYYGFMKHAEEEKKQWVRANFYTYHLETNAPMIQVCEFLSIEDAKKYFNISNNTEAFYYTYGTDELIEKEEKNKPFFMDEVLETPKVTYENTPNTDRDISNIHSVMYQYSIDGDAECFKYDLLKEVDGSYKITFNSNGKGVETMVTEKIGKKETEGKLNYELDWEFIEQMAERMSQNKGKYKPFNWKEPIDVEKLKQSLFRHVIEVMQDNYADDGRSYGHWESIALNAMMINYQLKNNSK